MAASSVVAQPLYKSVNERGEVTFSDKPVPDAVKVQEVEVQPGPSEAQRRESAERIKRMETQASELSEANSERTRQRKEEQKKARQQAIKTEKEIQPVTDYNQGYVYPRRPVHLPAVRPPNRPGHPKPPNPGQPGRPVQLPAGPALSPGR